MRRRSSAGVGASSSCPTPAQPAPRRSHARQRRCALEARHIGALSSGSSAVDGISRSSDCSACASAPPAAPRPHTPRRAARGTPASSRASVSAAAAPRRPADRQPGPLNEGVAPSRDARPLRRAIGACSFSTGRLNPSSPARPALRPRAPSEGGPPPRGRGVPCGHGRRSTASAVTATVRPRVGVRIKIRLRVRARARARVRVRP